MRSFLPCRTGRPRLGFTLTEAAIVTGVLAALAAASYLGLRSHLGEQSADQARTARDIAATAEQQHVRRFGLFTDDPAELGGYTDLAFDTATSDGPGTALVAVSPDRREALVAVSDGEVCWWRQLLPPDVAGDASAGSFEAAGGSCIRSDVLADAGVAW